MKTCVNCGAAIDDTSNFCPHCGTRCESGTGTEGSVYSPSENVSEHTEASDILAQTYPMKWHKFLMVIMILGGIVTIANGINTMMGTEYLSNGLDMERVYELFPGLKSCDSFYGIAMIALGVFEFTVRSRLKQFRANGPISLRIMYILSLGINVIYLAWATSVTGTNLFNESNIGSLIATILLMLVNGIYYSKRSRLFVH